MIGFARYVRCDCCYAVMLGILSDQARATCHGCGGRAIIGELPTHQALVRRARERLGRADSPARPPRRPGGREAA